MAIINKHLERWDEIYGDIRKDRSISELFEWLVRETYKRTGHKVVILIDEYDKPLTDNILDEELYAVHQTDLRGAMLRSKLRIDFRACVVYRCD